MPVVDQFDDDEWIMFMAPATKHDPPFEVWVYKDPVRRAAQLRRFLYALADAGRRTQAETRDDDAPVID